MRTIHGRDRRPEPKLIIHKFRCPCGTIFEKTQRELNLYGMGLNCPICGEFIDGEQNND
jgi:hypothetical protein